jgi:hypothetical protein
MGEVVADPEGVKLRSDRQSLLHRHLGHLVEVGPASLFVALEDSNLRLHALSP